MAPTPDMDEDSRPRPEVWLGELEYEQMRRALVIFFAANGCGERADDLPDEVFRVAEKHPDGSVDADHEGDPPPYPWTVAQSIRKTQRDKRRRQTESGLKSYREIRKALISRSDSSERFETRVEEQWARCLDKCMANITRTWRYLILEYYKTEETDRERIHQEMAEELGLSTNALRVRMFEIRRTLRECVVTCAQKKGRHDSPSS